LIEREMEESEPNIEKCLVWILLYQQMISKTMMDLSENIEYLKEKIG